MGISGTDLALTTARVGRMRVGAFRVGFVPSAVKGPGAEEPGEYIWDEKKPPTTSWTLVCDNWICRQAAENPWGIAMSVVAAVVPEGGDAGVTEFAFSCVITGGQAPFTYLWDFGDSLTSTEEAPSHTYDGGLGGTTVTVTLTVTDSYGLTATDTLTIELAGV